MKLSLHFVKFQLVLLSLLILSFYNVGLAQNLLITKVASSQATCNSTSGTLIINGYIQSYTYYLVSTYAQGTNTPIDTYSVYTEDNSFINVYNVPNIEEVRRVKVVNYYQPYFFSAITDFTPTPNITITKITPSQALCNYTTNSLAISIMGVRNTPSYSYYSVFTYTAGSNTPSACYQAYNEGGLITANNIANMNDIQRVKVVSQDNSTYFSTITDFTATPKITITKVSPSQAICSSTAGSLDISVTGTHIPNYSYYSVFTYLAGASTPTACYQGYNQNGIITVSYVANVNDIQRVKVVSENNNTFFSAITDFIATPNITITKVAPSQAICTSTTGSLAITISGANLTDYSYYSVFTYTSGATTPSGCYQGYTQNGIITVSNVANVNDIQRVKVVNQYQPTYFSAITDFTFKPQTRLVAKNPICLASGSLDIFVDNGENGNTYTITVGSTVYPNKVLQNGKITIDGFSNGNTIQTVKIKNDYSQCEITVNYPYTFVTQQDTLTVSAIIPTNPTGCNETNKGSLMIYLQNGVEGRAYDIFIDNQTTAIRKTLTFGALNINNYFVNGYPINSLKIQDIETGCSIIKPYSYTFQRPPFEVTNYYKIEPQNECGVKGTLVIKVPNSAGKWYRFNLSGNIYMYIYNTPSYYPFEAQGNANDELVITGFANNTVITGISQVYNFATNCFDQGYAFPVPVTFNNLKTNPEILGMQIYNPTSCNGTGSFRVILNTTNAVPAWQTSGEEVKVEILTSQGGSNFNVNTNYAIDSPQYPNGTTIYEIKLTRLSTGCTSITSNGSRFILQSTDLPVMVGVRQHQFTDCNKPMEIDIQLASSNATDTYRFTMPDGTKYIGTRTADGWYHITAHFYVEGYVFPFVLAAENVTKGCVSISGMSGYGALFQKTPNLNINSWTITQPETCGGKGKIFFSAYYLIANETYELWSNGVKVSEAIPSSVNEITFDVAPRVMTSIEIRGRNVCTPPLSRNGDFTINPPKDIKIMDLVPVMPLNCGATGSFSFNLVYLKSDRNYKIWAETATQGIYPISNSYNVNSTGGQITVWNVPYTTHITKIRAELIKNSPNENDCTASFDIDMNFIAPNSPILTATLQPIPSCQAQGSISVRIQNISSQPSITVNYTLNGVILEKTFTPPYYVGNEYFTISDPDFTGATKINWIKASTTACYSAPFPLNPDRFPSPTLEIVGFSKVVDNSGLNKINLTANIPAGINLQGTYEMVYTVEKAGTPPVVQTGLSQSFSTDASGNGVNVVMVGNQLVFTLTDFDNGDKVSFQSVSFGLNSAFCNSSLPNTLIPVQFDIPTTSVFVCADQNPISGKINAVVTETILVQGIKTDAAIDNLAIGENKKVNIQYFDGLGKPIQTVAKMESPRQKDIVQFIEYDEFNRTPKQYLPYTTNLASTLTSVNLGTIGTIKDHFRTKPREEQCNFYQKESTIRNAWTTRAYAQTVFEASPLNRALEQGAAGTDWQVDMVASDGNKHTIKTVMSFNTATGDDRVPMYEWNFGNKEVINSGFYAANTIIINTITDEHNNQVKEYKDKGGKVIMKKVFGDEIATTYYVYDDMDRLRVVLQPLAYKKLQTGAALDSKEIMQLSFRYDYDKRGRMTEKYVTGMGKDSESNPTAHKGTGVTLMVYDKLDRLVASQTPNQRNTNEWTWVKYDILGRQIMTGLYANKTKSEIENELLSAALFEKRATANTSIPNTTGYTSVAFPIAPTKELTVNYFDRHDNVGNGVDNETNLETKDRNVGKPISGKVRRLDTDVWERNEMWYDRYGRVSKSEATVLGISTTESLSSETFYRGFTPIVERTNSQMNYGATQVIINTRNTYDHSGRLKKLNYTLNSQPEITMAEYDYNELGQLSSKKLHKEGNNEFIQAITHQYNIRGWLTHINNNTRTTNLGTEQPLFGMELYYNTLPTAFGNLSGGSQPPDRSKAQFNGNISATSWSSIRDKEITNANIIRGFTYSYDKMNRLITANFQSVKPEELGRYSTTHSYDVNGNIQTTQRSGVISSNGLPQSVVYQYGQMDNMQYSYAGNRLIKVNDAITTQTTLPDFNDNGSTDIDYGYDNNGNLTKDLNKKIESIAYNHLNLPTKIIFTGKGNITYTYNAAGAKLTKTVRENTKLKITNYVYGFIFEKIDALPEQLKEFATPEGRIVAKTGAFQFQYHYKDHLGNVRMTFAGEEPLLGTMKLSFETDSLAKEKANFTNIVATREQTEGHKNSSFVGKLSRNKGMISSKILKLKQGEKLAVEVAAKYDLEDLPIPYEIAKSNKIKGLDFVPLLSVGEIASTNTENKAKIINFNLLGLLPLAKKLLSPSKTSKLIEVSKKPQAYLEITTYKDSLLNEVLTEKRLIIGAEAEENWLQVADSVVFSEDVFVVVKLINRADIPVLFDNLELRTYGTSKAKIIQENHYEPFGMTLQGLDYVAEDTRKNNYLYNGFKVERQEELGLFWDDSHARNYDMQGGRFVTVDPMTDEGGQESWSSYHYSYDNPVRYNDPDGKCPDCWEFANGFANAVAHNGTTAPNGAAIVPLQQGGSTSFSQGQTAGHVFSLFTGAVEIAAGFIGIGGSGGATVASGGTLAPAAVVVGLESAALVVHGGATAGNALHNLAENKGVVNASPPNPNGKNGGIPHQQKVSDAAKDMKNKGLDVKTEQKIPTPNGAKPYRYIDVVGKDKNGKIVEAVQVGKQNKNGTPISRERKAIKDIESSQPNLKIKFVPYN